MGEGGATCGWRQLFARFCGGCSTRGGARRLALWADAVEFEQVAGDVEAEARLKLTAHRIGGAGVKLDNATAARTDEMVVCAIGADVRWAVVAHVNGADDAEVGEQLQRAVDRRPPGLRVKRLRLLQNLLWVEVFALALDDFEHRQARRRNFVTSAAQALDQVSGHERNCSTGIDPAQ